MKKKRWWVLVVLLAALVILLPGVIEFCRGSRYASLDLPEGAITVSREGEPVSVIKDAEEQRAVREMLAGWDGRASAVPAREKRDLACPIEVTFGNGSTICLAEGQNYGRIVGDEAHDYVLPDVFVTWAQDLTSK